MAEVLWRSATCPSLSSSSSGWWLQGRALRRSKFGLVLSSTWKSRRHGCQNSGDFDESKKSIDVLKEIRKRDWLLANPKSLLHRVLLPAEPNEAYALSEVHDTQSENMASLKVIRDDLLHPLMGGNKLRKLDALVPLLEANNVTDVVTCGGCQSAHTTAVAVACAERGMRAHLLLRGEPPAVATGYALLSSMFGHVTYIPRHLYAERDHMLGKYAAEVCKGDEGEVVWADSLQEHSRGGEPNSEYEGELGNREGNRDSAIAEGFREDAGGGRGMPDTRIHDRELEQTECEDEVHSVVGREDGTGKESSRRRRKKVAIIREGAGDVAALWGFVRQVYELASPSGVSPREECSVVVDSGTGTSAIGIALGISLLGLPWRVVGVMLAGREEEYREKQQKLEEAFWRQQDWGTRQSDSRPSLPIQWVERQRPRKFGKIWPGEIDSCRLVAQQTGILLDPIYTLAGWETAVRLAHIAYKEREDGREGREVKVHNVVMLHTGGTLGLFGLAQRYPEQFCTTT